MEKKILIYGFDKNSEKYKAIHEEAQKLGIKVKEVDERILDETVGYLMDMKGFSKNPEKLEAKKDIEFMLLSTYDDPAMTDFLNSLAHRGVRIPHKAVITQTSMHWKFKYLLDHIEKEHRIMTKFTKLGKLVKIAEEKLLHEKDEELAEIVKSTKELTTMKDLTEDDLDNKYKMFLECGVKDFDYLGNEGDLDKPKDLYLKKDRS